MRRTAMFTGVILAALGLAVGIALGAVPSGRPAPPSEEGLPIGRHKPTPPELAIIKQEASAAEFEKALPLRKASRLPDGVQFARTEFRRAVVHGPDGTVRPSDDVQAFHRLETGTGTVTVTQMSARAGVTFPETTPTRVGTYEAFLKIQNGLLTLFVVVPHPSGPIEHLTINGRIPPDLAIDIAAAYLK